MFFEFSEVKLCGENKSLANYLSIMEMSIDFDSDDDYSGNNIGFDLTFQKWLIIFVYGNHWMLKILNAGHHGWVTKCFLKITLNDIFVPFCLAKIHQSEDFYKK